MSFPSQRKLSLLLQLDSSCNHEMDITVHGRIQLFIKDQNIKKNPPYVKVEVDVWPSDLIFFPSVMPSGGVVSRAFSLGN